jgi:hypothetical protein
VWIQCQNPSLAHLISDVLGDDDEWLQVTESLKLIRPWKTDEQFISRLQRVKNENKIQFVEQILLSVTQTEYIRVPNHNFQGGQFTQEEYITQKRILIDDVNSFFSQYILDTQHGFPLAKEDDLMIQTITIEDELFKTQDDQLFKLLSFSFMILTLLIKNISEASQGQGSDSKNESGASLKGKKKILFVIKVNSSLDPSMRSFLQALKTALLLKSMSIRLVIIEGEKCIAG